MSELEYINGPLSLLPKINFSKSKRISSYDRTGGNKDYITIGPMTKVKIAEIKGSGIIRHIWITASSENRYYLRDTILRMFWDEEENPSVEV
ncbi:MAG: hypothetical protein QXT08_04630, partial [Thermoproteota archaeon]